MNNRKCELFVHGVHATFEFDKDIWGEKPYSLSDVEEVVCLSDMLLSLERMFGGRSFDRALKAKELFRFRDILYNFEMSMKK